MALALCDWIATDAKESAGGELVALVDEAMVWIQPSQHVRGHAWAIVNDWPSAAVRFVQRFVLQLVIQVRKHRAMNCSTQRRCKSVQAVAAC